MSGNTDIWHYQDPQYSLVALLYIIINIIYSRLM